MKARARRVLGAATTDATEAALGVITLEADTLVSLDERLVDLRNLSIAESNFPSLSRDQLRDVVTQVTEALPAQERVLALDRVLEMVDKSQLAIDDVEGVKADPRRSSGARATRRSSVRTAIRSGRLSRALVCSLP